MFMNPMGGYAMGQQPMRSARGALNWNPGYGGGPFAPAIAGYGAMPFAGATSYGAQPFGMRPMMNAQPAMGGDFTRAIGASMAQDDAMQSRRAQAVNNIREMQMQLMRELQQRSGRNRALDLQELRIANA
jgi:hypothetical protein